MNKDVLDYALVVGNPAEQIGFVSQFGNRLNFVDNIATCEESGERYTIDNNVVKKVNAS
jgi:UDP-2-acetamido-3-amino-2,3-dideoxy-glucuronate N-acetyltransferase